MIPAILLAFGVFWVLANQSEESSSSDDDDDVVITPPLPDDDDGDDVVEVEAFNTIRVFTGQYPRYIVIFDNPTTALSSRGENTLSLAITQAASGSKTNTTAYRIMSYWADDSAQALATGHTEYTTEVIPTPVSETGGRSSKMEKVEVPEEADTVIIEESTTIEEPSAMIEVQKPATGLSRFTDLSSGGAKW